METEFTPIASLLGGALIGLSVMLLLLLNGRIAGCSGILASLLPPAIDRSRAGQSIAFVAGLLAAIPLYQVFSGSPLPLQVTSSPVLLAVGGFLAGAGSVLGNGCTSGHGVCGLARISGRSMVATAIFMAVAILVVFTMRHMVGS